MVYTVLCERDVSWILVLIWQIPNMINENYEDN